MHIENFEQEIKNYLIHKSNKVKINSQEVKKDDVFIALQGSKTHGNNFIKDVQLKGAKYIVTDKRLPKNHDSNCLKVNDIISFLDIW